jgi:hypothetical protein
MKNSIEDLAQIVSSGLDSPSAGCTEDYFVALYKAIVQEVGMTVMTGSPGSALFENANEMGFFRGPASTRFHGAFSFGLPLHSLGVLHTALGLCDGFRFDLDSVTDSWRRDFVLACLFHDFCKAGLYEVSYRNVKNEQGVWQKEPFYKVRDGATGVGHGTESLRRISRHIRLSEAWELAVAWHMGSFGLTSEENIQYMNACKACPEVLLLHTADMLQTVSHGV